MSPQCGDRAAWRVIVGPPGTGKTARLLQHLQGEIERGTPPGRIGFLTFTRAARDEARERVGELFGLTPEDLTWFRTIHSVAYALLGLQREQVVTDRRWREFGDRHGYALSDLDHSHGDELAELPRRTRDDLLRFAYGWGANRRLGVGGILQHCPCDVSRIHFPLFVERLIAFKGEQGLLDFPDMLERIRECKLRPDFDVAFLDEAQDLSPLQIDTVEMWFEPCRRVFIAGDDDQAIYRFQGAEPDWLLGLSRTCHTEILNQSHRVPGAAFALSQRIISRNTHRIQKRYHPAPSPGTVEQVDYDRFVDGLDAASETLILVRNREFIARIAREMFERRIPYLIEGLGGVNPLGSDETVRAVRATTLLLCGREIHADGLRAILGFIPSRGVGLLPHGIKEKAKALSGFLSPERLRSELGLGELLDAIKQRGPVRILLKLPGGSQEYLETVLMRSGEIPEPRIRVTTIHGSKGREADTVVVIPDMSRASYQEYSDYSRGGFEAENRVAYVAVTRAKQRLILVRPRKRRYYEYPDPTARDGLGGAA